MLCCAGALLFLNATPHGTALLALPASGDSCNYQIHSRQQQHFNLSLHLWACQLCSAASMAATASGWPGPVIHSTESPWTTASHATVHSLDLRLSS